MCILWEQLVVVWVGVGAPSLIIPALFYRLRRDKLELDG